MQSLILFALLLATGIITAIQIAREENAPNAPELSQIGWVVVVEDGGPEVTYTGKNIHDIERQIQRDHPGFEISRHSLDATTSNAISLNPTDILCDIGGKYGPTTVDIIRSDMNYLRDVKGRCHMPPGPGKCVTMSCAWRSGIVVCNDRPNGIIVNWNYIADFAHSVVKKCQVDDVGYNIVNGQAFDHHNWNVIVTSQNC